jgi:3'-phosphoadenosine 5'-phosphosulfate sulfotransferase (PAPS reductase)/FAD synthetase
VPKQLDQCVCIGIRLQFGIIRIFAISEWSDNVVWKYRADEGYPAAVLKIPGPVERLRFFRRISARRVPQPQQLGIESLVSLLLVLVKLGE